MFFISPPPYKDYLLPRYISTLLATQVREQYKQTQIFLFTEPSSPVLERIKLPVITTIKKALWVINKTDMANKPKEVIPPAPT